MPFRVSNQVISTYIYSTVIKIDKRITFQSRPSIYGPATLSIKKHKSRTGNTVRVVFGGDFQQISQNKT